MTDEKVKDGIRSSTVHTKDEEAVVLFPLLAFGRKGRCTCATVVCMYLVYYLCRGL
jgi:hypothetical protein